MIPPEILKKIRQIDLCMNRIVTEFAAGARVCDPQRSRIAQNRNHSGRVLSGEVAADHRPALRLFRPSPQFTRRVQSVFWPALTCVLAPRRGFHPVTLPVYPAVSPANPGEGFSKDTGSISASFWGEGHE
jgi:hypothetical protein